MSKNTLEHLEDIFGALGELEEVFGDAAPEDEEEKSAVQTALDNTKKWKDLINNGKELEVFVVLFPRSC